MQVNKNYSIHLFIRLCNLILLLMIPFSLLHYFEVMLIPNNDIIKDGKGVSITAC